MVRETICGEKKTKIRVNDFVLHITLTKELEYVEISQQTFMLFYH